MAKKKTKLQTGIVIGIVMLIIVSVLGANLMLIYFNVLSEQKIKVLISGMIILGASYVLLVNNLLEVFRNHGFSVSVIAISTISLILSSLWLAWILSGGM